MSSTLAEKHDATLVAVSWNWLLEGDTLGMLILAREASRGSTYRSNQFQLTATSSVQSSEF
jgi:hypothetical protein